MELTHFDENGNARMVDVGAKDVTVRRARARGTIRVSKEVMRAVLDRTVEKGDVLTVAQTAGILAAKKTAELIPMCHPLPLTHAAVTFETEEETGAIHVFCEAKTTGRTGVEMEALTGVQIALLTIYDMCKAMDKRMVMEDIHLVEKTGGKSGDFVF